MFFAFAPGTHIRLLNPLETFTFTVTALRRSSKAVVACLVEGFGRRQYKNDFIGFLVYSQASNDETKEHLKLLYETGSFSDADKYHQLREAYNRLGKKLHFFVKTVISNHRT